MHRLRRHLAGRRRQDVEDRPVAKEHRPVPDKPGGQQRGPVVDPRPRLGHAVGAPVVMEAWVARQVEAAEGGGEAAQRLPRAGGGHDPYRHGGLPLAGRVVRGDTERGDVQLVHVGGQGLAELRPQQRDLVLDIRRGHEQHLRDLVADGREQRDLRRRRGGEPCTGAIATRSGPSCASRTVSRCTVTSGLR